MYKFQRIQIIPLLMTGSLFIASHVVAGNNLAYRPDINISGPIKNNIRWISASEPYLVLTGRKSDHLSFIGGIQWNPVSWISVMSQIKYTRDRDPHAPNEIRPRMSVEVTDNRVVFKFAYRNRLEYRMIENQDARFRYRGRVKISFTGFERISPFVYEEIFYEFGDIQSYNSNESGIGVWIPLGSQFGLNLDFRWVHIRQLGQWQLGDLKLLTVFSFAF